jgi:hypothetical protein
MDQFSQLLALLAACGVGILAVLVMLRRQRRDATPPDNPFAVSTEGEKRCPKCGMGNLWTEARCISCGSKLPG